MKVFRTFVLSCLLSPLALVAGDAPIAVATTSDDTFDPSQQTIPDDQTSYLVMIDAGSSGSRVRAFKYGTVAGRLVVQPLKKNGKQWEYKPEGIVALHKVAPVDEQGVIDSRGKTALAEYIKRLLKGAKTIIPEDKRANTYVSLMATAGMRTLRSKKRNAIMRHVRKTLRKGPFKTVGRRTAYVLPGEDEGLFTWITINYLHNTLTTDNDEKIDHFYKGEDSRRGKKFNFKSTGVVEMGGASTQVAFIPGNEPLAHSYHYNVDDLDLTLYSTSYMNFGNDEARKTLIKAVGTSNPCGITGLPVEKVPTTWDKAKCDAAILKHALEMEDKCAQVSCAFDGRYMPRLPRNQKFIAVGAFTKAAKAFGCPMQQSKVKCLGARSEKLCGAGDQDKALELIAGWGTKDYEAKFLPNLCFMGRYTYLMLTKGLHFADDNKVDFMDKIQDANIGWEYGAAIFFVKMLERFERHRKNLAKMGMLPEEEQE